jgi:hypothetical protein
VAYEELTRVTGSEPLPPRSTTRSSDAFSLLSAPVQRSGIDLFTVSAHINAERVRQMGMSPLHLRRKVAVLCVGTGILFATACMPTPPSVAPVPGDPAPVTVAPSPPAGSQKPAIPATGTLFGMWEKPADGQWNVTGETALWNKREAQMGRTADIAHQFYAFHLEFPTWRETAHIKAGRTPMISWNGTMSNEVASGQHDALIRTRARALKALNAPIILRYFHEPDAQKNLDRSQSPTAYIAQWKKVHRIFAEEGVRNVAFAWCPTAWAFSNGTAPTYYPGDAYVDWICADGYNWGQTQSGDKWRDWTTIYSKFYAFGNAHKKPMIAGEYGSVERYAGEKAEWFRTMRTQVKLMPNIKAIVYFDAERFEEGVLRDWRIDTTPESLTAFTEMAKDPYFNTRNR